MAYVEARQYSNASDMLASAAAIRARLFGKTRRMVKPMAIIDPAPVTPDRWKAQHNAHMVNWAWGKSFKDYEKQTLETEGEFVPFHVEKVRIETIINKVSRYFDIPVIDLKSARRTRNIVMPRQVAMYLAKTLTGKSLPEIGRMFGGRDHTTILHGVRTVEERRHHHHIIAKAIDDLTADLQVAS